MIEEPTPDGLLLRRYRESRDEAAFAEIRRRHGRLVLATCRRETENAALAEDAAQGVFLLLIRKSFDDRASLAGWLHGASRLVSRNLMRQEGRRRRRERRAYEEFHEPDAAAWGAVSPHVDDALAALTPGEREAMLLRFAGERSLAEIGQALGIGENAARMRVSRALERMRGHLRRAGVGVGVVILASLLSARLADAEPPPFAPPSDRTRRPARVGFPSPSALLVVGVPIVLVAAGFGVHAIVVAHSRVSKAEATRLFRSMADQWQGTLEFADDATGTRTKTSTTVRLSTIRDGLRLIARYPRFASVDTTTIVRQRDGRYRIDTGGPGSSHRLDGLYDFVSEGDTPTFEGFSLAARGEVHLAVRLGQESLVWEEDVRRSSAFRLRNRFDLTRRP